MMEINHYVTLTIAISIRISREIQVALESEREEKWSSALTLCKQLTASAVSCDYVIVHLSAGPVWSTSQPDARDFLETDTQWYNDELYWLTQRSLFCSGGGKEILFWQDDKRGDLSKYEL